MKSTTAAAATTTVAETTMASAQSKRQKLANLATMDTSAGGELKNSTGLGGVSSNPDEANKLGTRNPTTTTTTEVNNFGVDVDDLTDETDTDADNDDDQDDDTTNGERSADAPNHVDIQEQLAAAGPAGVAAAAAIATARKRKRPHSFETNPSVRKRQQTRLIRKLRACIDEYTMRVGQQAVVLITMPGKAVHNFKVFGAQPLESVIRTCKHEIMAELEQALLEQAPQQFKEDTNRHELPPLVIDGIPTPVEKMTQAQLRAFIPLMLKYSTGRGKPGWGKDSTRPPWWPETLPWANVRSDARDESEKQRISWTTTLRQIVTNCYKYHGRDDLLPTFDENEESVKQEQEATARRSASNEATRPVGGVSQLGRVSAAGHLRATTKESGQAGSGAAIYSAPAYASNFLHTITNSDGSVSLVQVDPANAQILTLPDGTQVRAVRLQTLGAETLCGQQIGELQEASSIEISSLGERQHQALTVSEASMGVDGQIIVTGEDGTQSCYPMSSLVSIPASMYQQFAQGGQQLSIVAADGSSIPANAVGIHTIQESPGAHHETQQVSQVVAGEQPIGDQEVKLRLGQSEATEAGATNQKTLATDAQSLADGQSNGVVDRNGT